MLNCEFKIQKKKDGPCEVKRKCKCTDSIGYECGVDNRTYLNKCEREC